MSRIEADVQLLVRWTCSFTHAGALWIGLAEHLRKSKTNFIAAPFPVSPKWRSWLVRGLAVRLISLHSIARNAWRLCARTRWACRDHFAVPDPIG